MPLGLPPIGGIPNSERPSVSPTTETAVGLVDRGLLQPGTTALGNATNANTYFDNAQRQYNAPGLNGFAIRNADILGLGYERPTYTRPQSYAEGSPQLGLNPGALVGGLASLGTGFPGLGTLGGLAWDATGAPDPILTGGPSYSPTTGQLATPPGAPAAPSARATGVGGGSGAAPLTSATPSATSASSSTPVQAPPAPAAPTSSGSGFTATGQRSPSGGTIISGGSTIAWPWNTVNA
jgi:hypothetical protein